jgi:hypothetical protein
MERLLMVLFLLGAVACSKVEEIAATIPRLPDPPVARFDIEVSTPLYVDRCNDPITLKLPLAYISLTKLDVSAISNSVQFFQFNDTDCDLPIPDIESYLRAQTTGIVSLRMKVDQQQSVQLDLSCASCGATSDTIQVELNYADGIQLVDASRLESWAGPINTVRSLSFPISVKARPGHLMVLRAASSVYIDEYGASMRSFTLPAGWTVLLNDNGLGHSTGVVGEGFLIYRILDGTEGSNVNVTYTHFSSCDGFGNCDGPSQFRYVQAEIYANVDPITPIGSYRIGNYASQFAGSALTSSRAGNWLVSWTYGHFVSTGLSIPSALISQQSYVQTSLPYRAWFAGELGSTGSLGTTALPPSSSNSTLVMSLVLNKSL